jgi:HEAT repeat protein
MKMGFFKPNIEKMKAKRDVKGIIKALKDKNEDMRFEAALGLGELRDARAVEPLTQALNDKSSRIRWRAALSLGKIGDRRAVEPLIEVLKDEDDQVRSYAAEALGDIGDAKAVTPLIEALKDEVTFVGLEAASALTELGHIRYLESFLGRDHAHFHRAGVSLVRQIYLGNREGMPILLNALKNENLEIFTSATSGISRVSNGPEFDRERLRRMLTPAIQHLVNIVEEAEILESGIRSYDERVAAAILALSSIADLSAIPALEKLLAKVKAKVAAQGVSHEYVNTGIAAGFISSESHVFHIEHTIEEIRRRHPQKG